MGPEDGVRPDQQDTGGNDVVSSRIIRRHKRSARAALAAVPFHRVPGNSLLLQPALRAIGFADVRSGILSPQPESRVPEPS